MPRDFYAEWSRRAVDNIETILRQPSHVLEEFGPNIDLLRSFLALQRSDTRAALEHADEAAGGFLGEVYESRFHDLTSLGYVHSVLAKAAREEGLARAAVTAHRHAIDYYLQAHDWHRTEFTLALDDPAEAEQRLGPDRPYSEAILKEYRRLVITLGTEAAIAEFGLGELKSLRREVRSLERIETYAVPAKHRILEQIEIEFARSRRWQLARWWHQRQARQQGEYANKDTYYYSLGGSFKDNG